MSGVLRPYVKSLAEGSDKMEEIMYAARGSTTVVWNPGPEKARAVPDIGGDAWRRFVCVETANCGPHAVRLAPGARHAMTARIDVAPLDPR